MYIYKIGKYFLFSGFVKHYFKNIMFTVGVELTWFYLMSFDSSESRLAIDFQWFK